MSGRRTQARTLLSVYDLDNDILFLSPDGKWAGIVGRLNFTKDETRFVLLTNVEDGALRTLKLPHTRGVQWWTPSAASNVDACAIVRAALGPGKPFTPPLVLAPPP